MRYVIKKTKLGKVLVEQDVRKKERRGDSQLGILVIDTNLAIDHVLRFVEDGHEVYYYLANLSAFPKLEDQVSGDGFSGVNKVEDYGAVLDRVDLVVITDSCFPDLAVKLKDMGKPVFGPTPELVKMENDRVYAWRRARELGVGVPDGEVVRGLSELRKWLKYREDGEKRWWVKISKFRGSIETFSVTSVVEAEVLLSEAKFGPYVEELEFLVQEECSGVEIGCDAFVCPEGVLKPVSYTIEEKGRGNVAVFTEDVGFLREFYDKVMDVVKREDYRCYLCVEGFWDGSQFRMLEPTPRFPFPVSSLYPRFVKNYTEVIYGVATGKVVQPEVDWDNPYMAELTVSTDMVDMWRTIKSEWIGEIKDRDGVGFRRVVRKFDQYWFVPGDVVVATANARGKTVEESLERAKKVAESIECIFSQWDGGFVESVLEKVRKLSEELRGGFEFEARKS